MRAAASAPRGRRRTSSGAAVATTRPAPASPGAIGYRFSCLSLGAPGERGLHCPAGAPASISPPTPHRRESHGSGAGGRQSSPGGREEEAQRPPATGRRGGKGVRARGSRQPVSRGRPPHPPPHPLPSQVAHSSSGRCPLAFQSPRHSRNQKKNKTRKRPPPGPEEMALGPLRAPRGAAHRDPPVTSPRLTRSRSPDPVTALPRPPQGPFPGRRQEGSELPLPSPQPRPQARLGLLPLQIAQRPPAPFKVHEGKEFPIKLCQAVTSPPHPPPRQPTLPGQSSGQITLHSG